MLTCEQSSVVEAGMGNTVVFAAPGSGKTTVLTEHIMTQLRESNAVPSSLMVVTFTKQAATELKRRLVAQGGLPRSQIESIRVGTFHAQVFRMLLEQNPDVPVVLSPAEQTAMVTRAVETVTSSSSATVRSTIAAIAKCKSTWPVSEVTGVSKRIIRAYERIKTRAGRWDFDDILLAFCNGLETNRLSSSCAWLKYCLADEYQDTNQVQATILKALCQMNGASLFAVGDDDQCIYGFRGATPEWLIDFSRQYQAAKHHVLSENFRSNGLIVQHANALIERNVQRVHKVVRSTRSDEQGLCTCHSWSDETAEAAGVVELLRRIRCEVPTWSIAVLARTRLQLTSVARAGLRSGLSGIEYRTCHEAKGREWDVVHIVGAVQDNPYLRTGRLARVSEPELEEERRLFYVAMTRARYQLVVHWPRRIQHSTSKPLQFLQEAQLECPLPNQGLVIHSIRSLLSKMR